MTTPTPHENFDQRLQILESQLAGTRRSLRRAQRGLAVAAVIGLGLMIAAAADLATIDVLRTKRLEVINDDGHVVLAASGDASGGRVDLWTPEGCNIMRLAANSQGGDIALWNCEGRSVAGLYATDNGGEVSIWDSAGSRAARMHPGEHGGAVEVMRDGQARGALQAILTGAALELHDNHGHAMVSASTADQYGSLALGDRLRMTSDDIRSELTIRGADDKDIVTLRGTKTNDALLQLHSENGAVRLQTGEGDLLPKAALSNSKGQVTAHMTIRDHGGGTMTAAAADGTAVASIRADKTGNGRVDLSDESGTLMATMQTRSQRGATLALMAPNEKTVCAMAASADGGVLNLSNGQGVPVVVGGIAASRRDGAISVFNQRGIPVVTAGSTIGGIGQLDLNDENGHRLLSLPQRHASPEHPTAE
ncbi:MAG: hypothetical protein MK116_06160 [Phycisphaerales bacterium]|nr:hypothetical protein [Phycisphaerales bacterium]